MKQYSLRPYDGRWPQLGERVLVDPSAVVVGAVTIGDDSSVWPQAVIRGDVNEIHIGHSTSIQECAVLHCTHIGGPQTPAGFDLRVGNEVTVAHHVTLHGCRIGDRVLVGMGSIVMDGAVVEDEVVIGANSLVPPGKILRSGQLYMGSPARPVRALTAAEIDYFRYSAAHYVRVKNRHLAELEKLEKN